MKKFLMALVISIIGLTLGMTSVEAKRLGGGGSFGKSSPSYSRQAPMQNGQAAAPARQQPAAPAAAPSRMPWGWHYWWRIIGTRYRCLVFSLWYGS